MSAMCTELKDAGHVVVGTSDAGGHDDKHVEPPPGTDESLDDPPASHIDHTFHLSQITHYSSSDDSSNEHLARKPHLSWTSLALAGFVATVVGALIALAVTHMRSHKQQNLQKLPLESNNKLVSEERNSTTPYDDTDAWANAGGAARRNDNFNGTDQAIMFVLNID